MSKFKNLTLELKYALNIKKILDKLKYKNI